MTRQKVIVVGVDGGYDGLRAAEYAAKAAEAQDRSVRLVHAYHVNAALNPMLPLYGRQELRDFGEQALERAGRLVAERAPGVPVHQLLVQATPATALVHASRSASMVVIGRRHAHGFERALSGSTSTAVAAKAKSPVVSVPGSWSPTHEQRRIVVGTDGSPQGRAALSFGFVEATRGGSPLMVVRVWERPTPWHADILPSDDELAEWLAAAHSGLAEDLAGWSEAFPDVHVSRVVEHSPSPARVLVSRSEAASLLVVGARGGGGLPGLDLGWTARNVLAHSHVPVAVVHRSDSTGLQPELVPISKAARH